MFNHSDNEPTYRPLVKRWLASDLKVVVKGKNEIHLIAPCGDARYFDAPQIEILINKLEAALRECRAICESELEEGV